MSRGDATASSRPASCDARVSPKVLARVGYDRWKGKFYGPLRKSPLLSRAYDHRNLPTPPAAVTTRPMLSIPLALALVQAHPRGEVRLRAPVPQRLCSSSLP